MRTIFQWYRQIRQSEKGMTLLEVTLATAVVGIVVIGFFQGLITSIKSDVLMTNLSEAESLASSELEQIKVSNYIDYSIPGHSSYGVISTPADYAILVVVAPLSPGSGQPLEAGLDQGFQKISITVNYQGAAATSLEGYKVHR